MDKYGETKADIENNSSMTDWMTYILSNGDVLLSEVHKDRNDWAKNHFKSILKRYKH